MAGEYMWKVFSDEPCTLGEGPLWDHRNRCLYWVDILQSKIHFKDRQSAECTTIITRSKVGCLGLTDEVNVLLTGQKEGVWEIDVKTGTEKFVADPENHLPNNRFNDGKVDRSGNFWSGTMDEVNNSKGAGGLYMLDDSGNVVEKLTDISCSNGLAWSGDNRKFYWIDTGIRTLFSFDYDDTTFTLSNQQVIRRFEDSEGIPDGMTIDTEGKLWVAHWNGSRVARYDPLTGEMLLEIKLPASRITSCCFGGDDLNNLFITSARVGLSPEELKEQPLAGAVFVVENLPFKGFPSNIFKS